MMKKTKKFLSCLLVTTMVLSLFTGLSFDNAKVKAADTVPVLTFSESGITETVPGTGYTISDKALTISKSGVYKITGTCSDGSIDVKKSITGVVLILEDLDLTATGTAPIVLKKGSGATIHLEGSNKLTDAEDPADETSTDTTVADAFEGAAIKVKSGSALTICGSGSLDIYGNAKNGIKGGSEASVVIKNGTINVKNAANTGIGCDGSIVIDGGNISIKCIGDGIKSSPDTTDAASAGSVAINGGTINIDAGEDGIYADSDLTINDGTISVKTFGGYQASGFNSDTMSAKGLKSAGDRADVEHTITISGGDISLNTRDDAIHSDEFVLVNGGKLDIYTGDDGAHANTTLFIGKEGGKERDPEIMIHSSYEGLEGGSIYGYSGKVYVTASDDGINSAGGSSNGSDPGNGGGNSFNPGGGGPGGRPGPGGGGSGGGGGAGDGGTSYHMYFYGGTYFVDCSGDGIDANGDLNMNGGTFTVLSMQQGGDNSPLDTNGNLNINGATVFASGTNPMNENPSSSSQKCTTVTTNYSAGTILSVKSGSTTLYTEKLLRKVNYTLYSDPSITSNVTISTGSLDSCNSNAWAHNWGSEEVVTPATEEAEGLAKYTCADCSAVEYKTIPKTVSTECEAGHSLSDPVATTAPETTADPDATQAPETTDAPAATTVPATEYTGTFKISGATGATIDVFYKQLYTTPSETNVTSAFARDSSTGEKSVDGTGQINFRVNVPDGYVIKEVTATAGKYNNIKNVSAGIYRITKITGDLTITVVLEPDTGNGPYDDGDDTKHTALFEADSHVTGIDVYNTQTTTGAASETNVSSAIARNSLTGAIDITGNGQINFKVKTADGYIVDEVNVVSGTYTNIKEVDLTAGIYRITKITSDLKVSITTKEGTHPTPTPTAVPSATPTPTVKPSPTPTAKPSPTPTTKPTSTPDADPTEAPATETPADPTAEPQPDATEAPQSLATAAPDNAQSTATTAPAQNTTVDPATGQTQSTTTGEANTSETSNTSLKIVSIVCKKNAKKITGKLSLGKAVVKIKVGNNKFKKATVKGKKFTLKLSSGLKKKTKIQVKVTKTGYKAFKKKYTVK